MQKIIFIFLSLLTLNCFCQFKFSGKTSDEYKNATAYLTIVEDYKKINEFITEDVLISSAINNLGEFNLTGDFLREQDLIYKIYIDNCHENIGNAKHLLNNCLDFTSINFIANNTDSIYFPLNNMKQMLCNFSYNRKENTYIKQIDSLQENLLIHLENTINDSQRKLIYKNYFNKLKSFGDKLNHPLAKLYAYDLYANKNHFSRKFYLIDLKSNDYYDNLQTDLSNKKLTIYAKKLENDLLMDSFTIKKRKFPVWIYVLVSLLTISLILNVYFFQRKNRRTFHKIIPENVLTKQELNVFNLMLNKLSNKEIANDLFISLSTVKTHINNIYSKLSISSRKEIGRF